MFGVFYLQNCFTLIFFIMKIDWSTIFSVLLAMVIFKFVDRMFLENWATQLEGDTE